MPRNQFTNLGQLVLMEFWLLALVLLLYIKPREDVKQETKETPHTDHVKERYGAYIPTVWQTLQLRRYKECTSKKKTLFIT